MPEQRVQTAFTRVRAAPSYFWVAAVAALYLFIFVRVQWRIGDEGDILNGAQAVAEGRVPYRDFFDLRGPGSFYWLGLFFKVFGATWQVARAHLLLTGTLTGLLVHHLTRRVYRGPEAFLPWALVIALSIPFWAAPHHHWDSNLFALAAVAAFFHWQDHGGSRWLVVSGLLAGLTSCFIYQKGFLLLLSFLAVMSIWRLRFRTPIKLLGCSCAVLAGYSAVGLGVLAWFHHLGATQNLIDATMWGPLNTYGDANRLPYGYHMISHALGYPAPALRTLPPAIAVLSAVVLMAPLLLIAALPFLVVSLAGACLMTRSATRWFQLPIVSYCLAGFALWFSEIHRRDMMHLIYGCPLLLVALLLLWNCLDQRRTVRILVTAAVGIPLLFLAASRGVVAAGARQQIVTRRGPIVMPTDDAALRFLLSAKVAPGDYVFVYPYYPTYYFLADVRNPTRFGEMMYGPGCKPYFDEAIAAIEATRVKYILWDTSMDGEKLKEWFPAYEPPPERERWMELYFRAHYEQQGVLNGFRVLRRR